MPAQQQSRQDRLCHAIRSRTSRNPRRSRRTALGRPADECIGMMARLGVAPAVHCRMPFHQLRIIGGRHQTHAADRHEYGHPSPPCRSRPACLQRSRRLTKLGPVSRIFVALLEVLRGESRHQVAQHSFSPFLCDVMAAGQLGDEMLQRDGNLRRMVPLRSGTGFQLGVAPASI
jgi:hypothetical protein